MRTNFRRFLAIGVSFSAFFVTQLSLAEDSFDRNNPGQQYQGERFPTEPVDSMTPGDVCDRPDQIRYPERINYCVRAVQSSTKVAIIAKYDRSFGYDIRRMDRSDFKIDHLIPLCMGGSNEVTNLWPQHKSVYVHTDPIEQKLCELMAAGELSQTEAISMIKDVKHNLDRADSMLEEINNYPSQRNRGRRR